MDDFDDFSPEPRKDTGSRPGNCGWHWPLTLLSLVLVGGLSFLMAYLTRNVPERPVWLVGLIFMVPAGALFLSAMIMEFSMGAMTPSVSRSAQVKVAAIATAATLLVGCLCDAIYLYGGFVGDSSDNLLFLVYEGNTSGNSPTDRAVMQVLDDLYKRSGSRVETGLFFFTAGGEGENTVIPMAAFTGEHLEKMRRALINGEKETASSFGDSNAFEMVENRQNGKRTRLIYISSGGLTYGDGHYTKTEWDRDVIRMAKAGITMYYMGNGDPDKGMVYMTQQTGGAVITGFNADNVLENLQVFTKADGDMLRADTPSANILTGIMLGLEGLVFGFGLMLLLSVRGQKRFQVILSPLMAVLAFIILKVLPPDEAFPWWIREGTAFSLFGVVFMCRNYGPRSRGTAPAGGKKQVQAAQPAAGDEDW
jgi:hypothetical protein